MLVPVVAQEETTTRPIDDFVNAQGTFCITDITDYVKRCFLFVPPVPNFVGWIAPALGLGVSIDYGGLESKLFQDNGISLGTTMTTMDGTII